MHGLQDAIHIVLLFACGAAALRVVPSIQSIMYLNPVSRVGGTVFFLLAGVSEIGLIVHGSQWFFLLAAYFEAVALIAFLIGLARDLQVALSRLRLAFMTVRHHYGKDGDRIIATVTTALQGGGDNDRVRT